MNSQTLSRALPSHSGGNKQVRFSERVETFVIKSISDIDESLSPSLPPITITITSTAHQIIHRNQRNVDKYNPSDLFIPLSQSQLRNMRTTLQSQSQSLTRTSRCRWESTRDHVRDQMPTPAVRFWMKSLDFIEQALRITLESDV